MGAEASASRAEAGVVYGIAAFGVGPLESAGVDLPAIFGLAAIVAAAMGLLLFAVAGRRPEPASLHPRPP